MSWERFAGLTTKRKSGIRYELIFFFVNGLRHEYSQERVE